MKDKDCEDRAQAQLASLKRDMRKTMEDATVRAMHKVMAEFEAKSDERLMENAQGELERIKLVQTGVGIGKPEQEPRNIRERWNIELDGDDLLVCFNDHEKSEVCRYKRYSPATTTPPQRKPLTHEQRVDLLAKFEAHKHEWHAPAILIDMVEAAHNIKETP